MAVSQVKLRTLYIMKMLLEKTDEKYTMSAADIDTALRDYGMSADRKTVYNDIETLREFGMDVLQVKGTAITLEAGSLSFRSLNFWWTQYRLQSSSAGKSRKS